MELIDLKPKPAEFMLSIIKYESNIKDINEFEKLGYSFQWGRLLQNKDSNYFLTAKLFSKFRTILNKTCFD
jgi:hypothetical protein